MENPNKNTMLIVGVLVVLLIGGFFVFTRSAGNKKVPSPTVTPTVEEPTPTKEPTEAPTESAKMEKKEEQVMKKAEEMEVTLATLDKDLNQSGKAILTEKDGKVTVKLDLSQVNELKEPQPAHIHKGTCPGVGEVVYPLTNVVSGKSETVLNTTLAKIKEQFPLAINVHKSGNELKVYTTCGSLPK